MQTLYGAVMSRTVDIRLGYRDESGYEGSVSAFNALHAALPIIITVVMTYISVGIFDSILYRMYMSGKIPYYDPDSLFSLFRRCCCIYTSFSRDNNMVLSACAGHIS